MIRWFQNLLAFLPRWARVKHRPFTDWRGRPGGTAKVRAPDAAQFNSLKIWDFLSDTQATH